MEKCIFHHIIPAFAKIGKFADKNFTKTEIDNAEHKAVRTALQNQRINLLNAENSFNQICLNLKSTFRTVYEYDNHLNFIKSHVVKTEKYDDKMQSRTVSMYYVGTENQSALVYLPNKRRIYVISRRKIRLHEGVYACQDTPINDLGQLKGLVAIENDDGDFDVEEVIDTVPFVRSLGSAVSELQCSTLLCSRVHLLPDTTVPCSAVQCSTVQCSVPAPVH